MSSQSWNAPLFRWMGWSQLCWKRLVLIDHTWNHSPGLINYHSHFVISWRWRTAIDAITKCFVLNQEFPCKRARLGEHWILTSETIKSDAVELYPLSCTSSTIPQCQRLCLPCPIRPELYKAFKLNHRQYLGQISEVLPAAGNSDST